MLVRTRNKIAGSMAIIGGILIILGGGTGMVGMLTQLKDIVQKLFGSSNEDVEMVFWILITIAALGGIAVMIGGILIYKNIVVVGKIVIVLGTSMGIIGLIIGLIMAVYRGESTEFISWLTTSFLGTGTILSLLSRYVAKRPGVV
jgi:hypothetical protein